MRKYAIFFWGVLFFAFGFLFLPTGDAVAQTCSGGNCVGSPGECSSGDWVLDDNCPDRYCCRSGGGGQEGMACTSPGGQSGTCHDVGRCPAGQLVPTASAVCSNAGFDYCCVANSEGGGSGGGDGQCPSLNSYCHSSCTNYDGEKSACRGACDATNATRDLKYCNRSTPGGGGDDGGGGGGDVDTSTGWTGGLSAIKTESGLPDTSVSGIVKGVLMWILAIFGFIAIIGFIIAGIMYLTAAGNSKQIETAKTAMTWSIVGVIVALMGYVIILAADFLLSGSV